MDRFRRSTVSRLLEAALGSAALALFVLLVNPLPTDVLGQTAPTPTTATPTAVARAAAAAPAAVAPAAAAAPAPAAAARSTGATAQAPAQAAPRAAAQPAALPRTGTGTRPSAGMSVNELAAYGLLALTAAFGSAALVLKPRRLRP